MEENKKKVLIVEDDPALAAMYSEKLRREGFEAIIAKDGAAGLNMAITKSPDFILLDVLLPKMNGLKMFEKLIESPVGSAIPVIILTNVAERAEKERALALGAKSYMVKAMHSPEKIVNEVKRFISP